jgi:hypothetical protein
MNYILASNEGEEADDTVPVAGTIVPAEVATISAERPENELREHQYSSLAQMIADVSQDHAHLRAFIYEYARTKLRKELYPQFLDGAWTEIVEQMQGLESAIDRLETEYERGGARPILPKPSSIIAKKSTSRGMSTAAYFGAGPKNQFWAGGLNISSVLGRSRAGSRASLPIAYRGHELAAGGVAKHLQSRIWYKAHLLIAALVGVSLYVIFDRAVFLSLPWLNGSARSTQTSTVQKIAPDAMPHQAARVENRSPRVADIPIPTDYGAYAVIGGRLVELKQLAIKVPDPRVAISAAISVPSQTHLPAGPLQFVIFRKDLLNNAPERASIRVVAQIVRALMFNSNGVPKTSGVEQSWVIRNNSYAMRIGPLADNPEMIVVRPESEDFTALPAGRYVLVLKGIGYDFTIDGTVTDPAHCLERTDALNAPIYSECRKP